MSKIYETSTKAVFNDEDGNDFQFVISEADDGYLDFIYEHPDHVDTNFPSFSPAEVQEMVDFLQRWLQKRVDEGETVDDTV